jgi:hypothetical protein
MSDTKLPNYPARLGDVQLIMVDHTGPSSYATGGELLGNSNNLTGISTQGLSGIDSIVGSGSVSQSGNYIVVAEPTGSGLRKQFKLVWFNTLSNQSNAGVPLMLGTASAAASTSAYSSNGVLTVVVANSLKANQIVVLSGGASNASKPLCGVPLQVLTATSTQFTANFAQGKALTYSSVADTSLKYQVVQAIAGNPLVVSTATAQQGVITGVLATANLLTLTIANAPFVQGQFISVQGLVAGEYAQGAIVQVASVTTSAVTANWQGSVINQTSGETGTASLLVTNGSAPVQATGAFGAITNSTAVASAATVQGTVAFNAAQNFVPGNIIVAQGLATRTALDGTIGTVVSTSLTNAAFTANTWTVVGASASEASGTAAVLITGIPVYGDVNPGTNLSGETVRIGYLGR